MRNLISCAFLLAAFGTIVAAILVRPRVGHPVTDSMREDAVAATNAIVSPLPAAIDRRPLVVIFILPGCPCSESYEPYVQQLFHAYGSKIQFLGVIEGTELQAAHWKQKHETPFDLIVDHSRSLAKRFQAKRSAYTALIQEGNVITKLWPGYSEDMLDELTDRLSNLTDQQHVKLKFTNAPGDLTSGCLIEPPM